MYVVKKFLVHLPCQPERLYSYIRTLLVYFIIFTLFTSHLLKNKDFNKEHLNFNNQQS